MVHIVLIQGSLNPNSRTAILIDTVAEHLDKRGIPNQILDLRQYQIPFCDGRPLDEYPEPVPEIRKLLDQAEMAIIGFPIYMYSFSGVIKNFLDIFHRSFQNKICGVAINAGGSNSYLASRDLMNSMAFESGTIFVQPTVYTFKKHYTPEIEDPYIHKKIDDMIDSMLKLYQFNANAIGTWKQ